MFTVYSPRAFCKKSEKSKQRRREMLIRDRHFSSLVNGIFLRVCALKSVKETKMVVLLLCILKVCGSYLSVSIKKKKTNSRPYCPCFRVSFCTFLAHEYPEQVHKVVMINGGGPTALEPSLCSIFQLPSCVLHCLSPCLAWSFLKYESHEMRKH